MQQRILGALYGSLVGDALGVPVEFFNRNARKFDPVIGMRAFGVHNQPAGTWSDDGALLLCAAESLAECGFQPQDMGERFVRWYTTAYWSAHGNVFDIGNATATALSRINHGTLAEEAGGKSEHDNGNGSLMRIIPVPLWCAGNAPERLIEYCCRASNITHGHTRSQMACALYGLLVLELLGGNDPLTAWQRAKTGFKNAFANRGEREFASFNGLLTHDYTNRAEADIESSGYVLHTLEASVWCLLTTQDFASCVLKAVNLGSDTDTTGCVAGGLAGVYYGVDTIPADWVATLPRQADLASLFKKFTEKISQC